MENKVLSRLYDRKESLENEIYEKELYIKQLKKMLNTSIKQIEHEENKKNSK